MALPALLRDNFSIPMVGAPLCILSNPDLVIEQCEADVVASFPALNARPNEPPDDRLQHDIDMCEKYRVPIQITSLRAPDEVVASAHRYGCLVFHDVTNVARGRDRGPPQVGVRRRARLNRQRRG